MTKATVMLFADDPVLKKYYQRPRGVPRKELERLQNAFFEVFTQYNPTLFDEHSDRPNRNANAIASYSIDLPKQLKRLPNKDTLVSQWDHGYLRLSTDVNPRGVTGPDDIARTYVISVSFRGEIRPYRHRYADLREYATLYVYGRTAEEAVEKFKKAWETRIVPIFS